MIRSDPTPTGTLVGRNASNGVPTEYYLLPTMLGDEELREETERLCTKYQKLFSTSVSPEPADLKPMELVVDQNKNPETGGNYACSGGDPTFPG